MAWRELDHGGRHWLVSLAAERRPQSPAWALALSFRCTSPDRLTFWASYPIESSSKAALFAQAEQVPVDALRALVDERFTAARNASSA
jgi:hypothetical protein